MAGPPWAEAGSPSIACAIRARAIPHGGGQACERSVVIGNNSTWPTSVGGCEPQGSLGPRQCSHGRKGQRTYHPTAMIFVHRDGRDSPLDTALLSSVFPKRPYFPQIQSPHHHHRLLRQAHDSMCGGVRSARYHAVRDGATRSSAGPDAPTCRRPRGRLSSLRIRPARRDRDVARRLPS